MHPEGLEPPTPGSEDRWEIWCTIAALYGSRSFHAVCLTTHVSPHFSGGGAFW